MLQWIQTKWGWGHFFMDDYLFCKSALLFFHSALVLPYFYLGITLKVFRSKKKQNCQTQYRTSKFFKRIFWACCQKFYSIYYPEQHFVVSTMTARGFLNGWHRLTKEWECWQRSCNKFNILILQQSLYFLLWAKT